MKRLYKEAIDLVVKLFIYFPIIHVALNCYRKQETTLPMLAWMLVSVVLLPSVYAISHAWRHAK